MLQACYSCIEVKHVLYISDFSSLESELSSEFVCVILWFCFDLSVISLILNGNLAYTHTEIYLITFHLLFVGFIIMLFIQSCIVDL